MVGSNTRVIELGTHRTVYKDGSVRRVVWHNPPRNFHEVLTDIQRRVEGEAEVATPETATPSAAKPAAVPVVREHVRPEDMLASARNVLQDPLLRLSGTTTDRVGGIRLRQATEPADGGKPSLGQYRDFRDKARSLPQLNAVTVKGILIQPGALDTQDKPTEEGLKAMARAASTYRRQNGFGGGDCGPESVELYIRVFRALGLTREAAQAQEGEALQRFYLAYLRVFAS